MEDWNIKIWNIGKMEDWNDGLKNNGVVLSHYSIIPFAHEESQEEAMKIGKRVVQTEMAPKAIGPYSQAIQAGNFLFLSGQIPLDPKTGELVKGDIRQQTKQVLNNLEGVLGSEKLEMKDVVKVTIFLRDIGNFNQVNDVYATYFPSSPPARSTVQVAKLPRDAEIEIEAIALI